MTGRQRWNLGLLVAASAIYLGLLFTAPKPNAPSPYHFSAILVVVLSATILGFLLLAVVFGFYAWLELDRYAQRFPEQTPTHDAYARLAQGVWFLTACLIGSTLLGAIKPFFATNASVVAAITQINYFVVIIFPFLGFLNLRTGSRHLAVSAQAIMTARAKLVTVGPPLVLLSAFYVFLSITNTSPGLQTAAAGPIGFLVLPASIILVVGTWTLGLLAALNIERATYRGEGAKHARPLVKLYNGVLTTTGGFIILDALLSLGSRVGALPVAAALFLVYTFIGVVALGFYIIARGARGLLAIPVPRPKD